MPIKGKFYTFKELQSLLAMTEVELRSHVNQQGWVQPFPDLFYAEEIEATILVLPDAVSVQNYDVAKAELKAKRDEFFFNYSYVLTDIFKVEQRKGTDI